MSGGKPGDEMATGAGGGEVRGSREAGQAWLQRHQSLGPGSGLGLGRVRARFRVRVRVISPSPSPNPTNPTPYQHDDNVSHAEKSGRVTPTVSAEEAAMGMEAVGDRPAAALFNVLLGSV